MDRMSASDTEYDLSRIMELVNGEENDEFYSVSPSNYYSSDQMVPPSTLPLPPRSFSPLFEVDSMDDHIPRSCQVSCDEVSFDGGTMMLQQMNLEFPFVVDSADGISDMWKRYKFSKKLNEMTDTVNSVIPRPPKPSLDEKMLKAMHLCSERLSGGTLAQLWIPVRNGDGYLLRTTDQPFLRDGTLSGYHEVSRLFSFAAEPGASSLLGLPGRVFTSKVPEWTSNVMYYNETEYLRVRHAIDHDIRGSIALPVFDDNMHERSCFAVIELVTTEEKPNFDVELEIICHALQAVNLSSGLPPQLSPQVLHSSLPPFIHHDDHQNSFATLQSLSSNQNAVLAEIKDILCTICRAHQLPLALTWVPCSYSKNVGHNETEDVLIGGPSITPNDIPILCLEETTCCWNDTKMEGFVHACANHFLQVGKGLVGKAFQSSEPFFYHDIKEFHVSEYPMVHHARKLGLSAAVAIRLRSIYTGSDDYVLEFFLPVNIKGAAEQLLLLNDISETMERVCRSLRTVSHAELVEESKSDTWLSTAESLMRSSEKPNANDVLPEITYGTTRTTNDDPPKQTMIEFKKPMEKKQSTSEKHFSLNVLQQYFSGSLKDAAKSLGVCPTTLKRICRQHGISRWPSRKIKKVDRSLKKIRSMLESVPGMEGGLEFDPTKGGLVAAFSVTEFDKVKNSFLDSDKNLSEQPDTLVQDSVTSDVIDEKREEFLLEVNHEPDQGVDGSGLAALDTGLSLPADLNTMAWMVPNNWELSSGHDRTNSPESRFVSRCSSSINDGDGMDNRMIDGVARCSKQASSGMTDSSNGSGSVLIIAGSSSSSGSLDERSSVRKVSSNGTNITVKATYRENTVRFKFEPAARCSELYAEVAKRFELQTEEFQLKYVDDDEEWVLLVTDSDLLECVAVLELLNTRTVKILVDDTIPSRHARTYV